MSRCKTEYLKVGGADVGEELKLERGVVKKFKNFKYLGSTVSSDGRCEEEVRKRIQAGWMSWKKVSRVVCDRKLSATVKGKMYQIVTRPAMLYGIETVAINGQKAKGKDGRGRVKNGEMSIECYKKEQDKERAM